MTRTERIVNLPRLALLAAVCFVAPSATLCQHAIDDPLHDLTLRGIDSLYNLRFESAESLFDEAIRIGPNDPRGWFFKSMVHFYVYQLTQDQKAYDRFFELSETVLEKAEEAADRDPADLTARFYLGGIYGYRGLAFQRNGNLLSALWDGRKGYGYLREAATGPRYSIDAKMGFGLFTYLVAKIPRSFSWVLGILGFSGDLEGGLSMMKAAADSGVYTRTEASFYYAQFCFFEKRYDEAYRYMERIIRDYPENSLFLVTFAAWELRQDRVEEAIAIAQRAIDVNSRNAVSMGDEFAHSTLAAAYYALNAFPEAAHHWEEYMERTEIKGNISNSVLFRLGITYEILGNRPKALTTWKQMGASTDEDRPWDSVYWRRVQRHIKRPLTRSDVLLTLGQNLSQIGKKREALPYIDLAVEAAGNDREQRSVALYERLSALASCEDHAAVVQLAPEILRTTPREELWVLPHALFRLGEAYAALGRRPEARSAFTQALGYDDYDWEVSLRDRIERALEKVRTDD